MRKVIKLKESDITNIVRRILREDSHWGMGQGQKSRTRPGEEDYTGHKGDISKTGGRDYETDGRVKVRSFEDVKRALGNPRTIDEVVINYEKLYNCQPTTEGMPTPEEIRTKMDEIGNNPTGGDPVISAMWILFGVFAVLMILICIDW